MLQTAAAYPPINLAIISDHIERLSGSASSISYSPVVWDFMLKGFVMCNCSKYLIRALSPPCLTQGNFVI